MKKYEVVLELLKRVGEGGVGADPTLALLDTAASKALTGQRLITWQCAGASQCIEGHLP
jgi:hypothetical protein